VEGAIAALMLLALLVFYNALLGPQVAFAGDRVELMSLRELWAESAAGFGLRSEARPREFFLQEYRSFRGRLSVRKLLLADSAFATLATRADKAFDRLSAAEIRGDPAALAAAEDFDQALRDMATRVGEYAQGRLDLFRGFFLVIVAGLVLAIAGFVVLELRLRSLVAGEARKGAFSRALMAAQEGERLRIARDLHDAVAQDLAAAKLYCGLDPSQDSARVADLLDRSIEEIRKICYGLRPAEIDRLGIAGAAARLCEEVSQESGMEVTLSTAGLEGMDLRADAAINLYRILQEALANVRRHSGAARARVDLRRLGGWLELSVDDNGRGPGSARPGLGRTGMEERARLLGGGFRFGQGLWGGTSIRVNVPIAGKEDS
jgi:signal transduction histidine kinase